MRRLIVWCEGASDFDATRALSETWLMSRDWLAEYPRDQFSVLVGGWERAPRASSSRPFGKQFVKKPSFGAGTIATVVHNVLLERVHEGLGANDCVFVVKDTDGDHDRRHAVDHAIGATAWPFRIVTVMPHPELEVWEILLADVDPDRATKLRNELGLSPLDEPTRLNSTRGDERDCKVVLAKLGLTEWRYEDWVEVPLSSLESLRSRRQGAETGFTRFLEDLDEQLVSLLVPRRA